MKKTIALICGGKSPEHEVSLQSAYNVYQALDTNKYTIILIGITTDGVWKLLTEAVLMNIVKNRGALTSDIDLDSVALLPGEKGKLYNLSKGVFLDITLDVALPIIHGPFAEDGTVQGLLELAGVAYVGAGVLGSAIGMDKEIMKRLLSEADIPIGNFMVVHAHEQRVCSFTEIKQQFGVPIFIKPANMGSSVGVHRVETKAEFGTALADAFLYDTKVIIEQAIVGREVECAVLGNENPKASVVGEVVLSDSFYSYETKYLSDTGAKTVIPAELSQEQSDKIRMTAIATYKALACCGMGRVDMFLTEEGNVLVNEINTLPGFTNISMYPKLWEASGVSYAELLDRLIRLAEDLHKKRVILKNTY